MTTVQTVSSHSTTAQNEIVSYSANNSSSRLDITELFIRCATLANQSYQQNRVLTAQLRERNFTEQMSGASNPRHAGYWAVALAIVTAVASLTGNQKWSKLGPKLADFGSSASGQYYNGSKAVSDAESTMLQQHGQQAQEAARKSQEMLDRTYSDHQKFQEAEQAAVRAIIGR